MDEAFVSLLQDVPVLSLNPSAFHFVGNEDVRSVDVVPDDTVAGDACDYLSGVDAHVERGTVL